MTASAPEPDPGLPEEESAFTGRPLRSGRSQARRMSLLEAADRVVRRSGPEASMAAIAAEAGISKTVVSRHFGDTGGVTGRHRGRGGHEEARRLPPLRRQGWVVPRARPPPHQ